MYGKSSLESNWPEPFSSSLPFCAASVVMDRVGSHVFASSRTARSALIMRKGAKQGQKTIAQKR